MKLNISKCFGRQSTSDGKSSKRRSFHCKIILLDETQIIHEIQESSRGQDLLDFVFRHLNLLESAYFGLRFIDSTGQPKWLSAGRRVMKELKGVSPMTLFFGAKFYAVDPCKLVEEITRYQFFLQIKQDILRSRLPVGFDLASELFALSVQSELGDYDPDRHKDGYISEFRFLPTQSKELEARVTELHKGLMGKVPAAAEMAFLERVKWLDLYGADLHPVLGEDNQEYFLALTPSGVLVLRNKTKVGNYFWPRISKIYRKGKFFMLKVWEKKEDEEKTYGFELPSETSCKHLCSCCLDHKEFFSLALNTKDFSNNSSKVHLHFPNITSAGGRLSQRFKMSSSTRRSSTSLSQLHNHHNSQILRSPPTVVRVPSRRYQRRIQQDADGPQKNGSIILHPDTSLLPVKSSSSSGATASSLMVHHNPHPQQSSSTTSSSRLNLSQAGVYRSSNSNLQKLNTGSSSSGMVIMAPKSGTDAGGEAGGISDQDETTAHHSVVWSDQSRGLFSSPSVPNRLSSTVDGNANHLLTQVTRVRSSSTSSSHRRHSRFSDNESEVSKSSRRSRHSNRSGHSSRCRHRKSNSCNNENNAINNGEMSGTESDSSRKRHRRRHRHCSKNDLNEKLVNSEQQWIQIQKLRQSELNPTHHTHQVSTAVLHKLPHHQTSGYHSNHHNQNNTESESDPSNQHQQERVRSKRHTNHHSKALSEFGYPESSDVRGSIHPSTDSSRLFHIRYSPTTGKAKGKFTSSAHHPDHRNHDSKSCADYAVYANIHHAPHTPSSNGHIRSGSSAILDKRYTYRPHEILSSKTSGGSSSKESTPKSRIESGYGSSDYRLRSPGSRAPIYNMSDEVGLSLEETLGINEVKSNGHVAYAAPTLTSPDGCITTKSNHEMATEL